MEYVISSRNFNAPNPAPSQRFSQPREIASIAFVNKDATSKNNNGTTTQITTNANICANVIESVILEKTLSATDTYSAFAASNPTINPRIDASCLMKPFIKPMTAPAPITTNRMISIIVITISEKDTDYTDKHGSSFKPIREIRVIRV